MKLVPLIRVVDIFPSVFFGFGRFEQKADYTDHCTSNGEKIRGQTLKETFTKYFWNTHSSTWAKDDLVTFDFSITNACMCSP